MQSIQNADVIPVQSLIRRTLACKELERQRHRLDPQIIDKLQPCLLSREYENWPNAIEGKNYKNIYISESDKLVIRYAPDDKAKVNLVLRSDNKCAARNIIEINKFKHLKVARFSLVNGCMVEKLLPSIKGGASAAFLYYVENHQFYDKPAEEITQFFMQTRFEDFLGNSVTAMKAAFPNGYPRFDNLLLGEKKKNGQTKYVFGFPDLERFAPFPVEKHVVYSAAKKTILLLPYQYKIIVETCRKSHTFTKLEESNLEYFYKEALKGIEQVHGVHTNFMAKRIELKCEPFTEFFNSPDARSEFVAEFCVKLLKMHNKDSGTHYLLESTTIDLKTGEPCLGKQQSAIVNLKFLGTRDTNAEELLNQSKDLIFKNQFDDYCSLIAETITQSLSNPEYSKYEIMAKRILVLSKSSTQNTYNYTDSNQKNYQFSAKAIDRRFVKKELVHPSIIESFVKERFHSSDDQMELCIKMMKLLKKKGLIANVIAQKYPNPIDSCVIYF